MRSCLVYVNKEEVWTDDDRQDPADKITILGENGYVHVFHYAGEGKSPNHTYRRYVEKNEQDVE